MKPTPMWIQKRKTAARASTTLTAVRVGPDDTLVFETDQHITLSQANDIKKKIAEYFPNPAFIIGSGQHLTVLHRSARCAPSA